MSLRAGSSPHSTPIVRRQTSKCLMVDRLSGPQRYSALCGGPSTTWIAVCCLIGRQTTITTADIQNYPDIHWVKGKWGTSWGPSLPRPVGHPGKIHRKKRLRLLDILAVRRIVEHAQQVHRSKIAVPPSAPAGSVMFLWSSPPCPCESNWIHRASELRDSNKHSLQSYRNAEPSEANVL